MITDSQFSFGWIVEEVEGDLVADTPATEKILRLVRDGSSLVATHACASGTES